MSLGLVLCFFFMSSIPNIYWSFNTFFSARLTTVLHGIQFWIQSMRPYEYCPGDA